MPLPADNPNKLRDSYACLGLEPEATMREIEAAYWQFARELRGQPAMAAYTQAYETLVNRNRPPAVDTRQAPAAPQEIAPEQARPAAARPSPVAPPEIAPEQARPADARPSPVAPPEIAPEQAKPVVTRPPSKFGWPSN